MNRILVLYDSKSGNVARMAQLVAEGARCISETEVRVRSIDEAVAADVLWCDGLAVGSPTNMGVLSWKMKKFWDEVMEPHWMEIDGKIACAFSSAGGWGGGINAAADPKVKDAAYAFFSYMTQPAQSNSDVTIGGTGFNPYRTSQLSYSDLWKNAGMTEEEAKVYLGAINASMSSPNMILDLRIPQNQKYQQVVLDEAISRYLSGEIDVEATVKAVNDGWNELNEEIGVDEQLTFYKATIGAE